MNDTTASTGRTTSFRGDINGLRAIAVLSVLGFHFGIPVLSGGFVGVDVFFVISGFLMTGIVVTRLERGSFSLPGFFLDRARRIIPPLAVLLVMGFLAGAALLMPDDFFVFAKHAAGSVLFLSNMIYWREGSYFAPEAENKWLLHTWSLSVEWQFYLVYPIILLLLCRILSQHKLRGALLVLGAASLALMLYFSVHSPQSGFFLLPPRAWEMIAGGIVYLSCPLEGVRARVAQILGLALIVGTILLMTDAAWPNMATIAPVLGTALVILATRRDSRITDNALMRWVGLNSYSIYLWHWPLAVVLRRGDHTGDWRWVVGALAASLLLGHMSYRFVERGGSRRPTRPHVHTGPIPQRLMPHLKFAVMVAVVALVGAVIWKGRGFPQRFSPEVQAMQADLVPGTPFSSGCFSIVQSVPEPCVVGPRRDRAAIIVRGDSHADAAISAVVAAVPADAPGGVGFNAYASCAPLLGGRSTDPDSQCGAFNARYLPPLTRPRGTPVLLIAYWDEYFAKPTMLFGKEITPSAASFGEALVNTGCALAKAGPTYMLLPTPKFPSPVAQGLQHALVDGFKSPEILMSVSAYDARNRAVLPYFHRAAQCGVKLLDPLPYLCPRGRCLGTKGNRAIIRDEHHLTEIGNKRLTPLFQTIPLAP